MFLETLPGAAAKTETDKIGLKKETSSFFFSPKIGKSQSCVKIFFYELISSFILSKFGLKTLLDIHYELVNYFSKIRKG